MPEFETSLTMLLLVAVAAYLLGSVPFGVIISRVMGLADPRTVGSKSIGATNVLRSGSKVAALGTLLLDAAKGLVAVLVAKSLFAGDAAQVAGLFAFVGHLFSVWLNFRGGKGVATALGVLLGLSPMLGLIGAAAWLFTYFVFRYSSLSALMAAVITPAVAPLIGFGSYFVLLVVMSVLLIWRHKANIERLRDGTEPMVDWGSRK